MTEETSVTTSATLYYDPDLQILANNDEGSPLAKFAGYWLPVNLPIFWSQIYNFDFHPQDVLISTFPKSGTHWVYYVVFLLKTQNFDPLPPLLQRPHLEVPYWSTQIQDLSKLPPPRVMTTHLGGRLFPKKAFDANVVYVYRDPRDLVISDYYHYIGKKLRSFNGSFEDFIELFMRGDTHFGPYPRHLEDILKLRNEGKRILFVRYEDLAKDPTGQIRRIAKFIGVDADDELVDRVVKSTQADAMKKNDSANGNIWRKRGLWNEEIEFIRKGRPGGWQEEFGNWPALLKKFEKYLEDNVPLEFRKHTLL